MPDERRGRIRAIFEAACELEPEERRELLAKECSDDPTLGAEVERLLQGHDAAGGFIDDGPFESEPIPTFTVNDTLAGRFQIVQLVGRGGMGEVYEARDLDLGERVALKTLRRELLADPTFLRRFRREVQLARRVGHRNVCRVHDVGYHRADDQEIAFLTMEFLEGETLRSYMKRRGRLSPDETLALARPMADGLGALHEANIVHRDFKPGNVILVPTDEGSVRPVITDFGLALPALEESGDHSRISLTGHTLGTPDYMAPEQINGEEVSARTDIYALGLVLYEMITGSKPFPEVAGLAGVVQRVTVEPDSPRMHSPELRDCWVTTLQRCLERQPKERFVTAGQVIGALDGEHQPLPEPGTQKAEIAEALEPASRKRMLIASVAAIALLVGGVLTGSVTPAPTRSFLAWFGISWGPQLPEEIRLAILPFRAAASAEISQELGDSLTEALTNQVEEFESAEKKLTVVPFEQVFSRVPIEASEANAEFGANLILSGELEKVEGGLLARLELTNPASGEVIDSRKAEQSEPDLADLRNAMVKLTAEMLGLEAAAVALSSLSDVGAGSQSEAYEYYLQGRGHLLRHDNEDNISQSIQLFHRALGEEPKYAAALAGLGEAHWRKYELQHDDLDAQLALQNAANASRYDRSSEHVHLTLGLVHLGTGRYEEALADYHRALELAPRSAEALIGLAKAHEHDGKLDSSRSNSQEGHRFAPVVMDRIQAVGFVLLPSGPIRGRDCPVSRGDQLDPG